MADPIALAALSIDAAIGWPGGLYRKLGHPVGFFAAVIDRCERAWNRASYGDGRRRAAGAATVLLLALVAGGTGWGLQSLALRWLGNWGWIAVAAMAWPGLAQRSLYDHVRAVAAPLAVGDLPAARAAVAMIVGRDTASLDEAGVARAAIESLAESFGDGVAAPLFWLLAFGLPGLWIYKAVNTADSMIGHREEPFRMFGWAAARSDDVLNYVPARLAGVLICIAGAGGWAILWRDARKHASPNSGWPEAAMAGALRLRLAGPIFYERILHDKPWIGNGTAQAGAPDITRSLDVYLRACLLLWIVAGVMAWGG